MSSSCDCCCFVVVRRAVHRHIVGKLACIRASSQRIAGILAVCALATQARKPENQYNNMNNRSGDGRGPLPKER
jgi:hypothetical protein